MACASKSQTNITTNAHTKAMPLGREILAAGLGCATADSLFNTLEVLKVRAQLNPDTSESVLSLGRRIVSAEGIGALALPGLGATQLRGMTYTGFRIGAYPETKRRIEAATGFAGDSFTVRAGAGLTTGSIGSALFTPVDLVRVRLQAEPASYAHVAPPLRTFFAFQHVSQAEGLSALYRGVSACVLRGALLSASQLATYDATKATLKRMDVLAEGPALHLFSSCLSGLVAQTVIQPADTLKTVMMSGGGGSRGIVACAAALVRDGGVGALYRGYLPALLRQGPVIMVQMPLIEQLRRLLGVGYM